MTSFRFWLLLLLAVLLPARGALAVSMPCSGPPAHVQAQAQPSGHGHEHVTQESSSHHDATAHEHTGTGDAGGHGHTGASDKCNLCAASCSVTGLVSGSVTVAELQPVSTVFPHLYVPPASFVPEGQERPPRTV
ncbi:hypothetical protein WG922_09135 [Ramlibacter sp. AN1015]|uniref:hypothetical protein n=1 Tax=Ramlibacter sp. AN1015 TaxID=3133428 RepID=UPI0030BEB923